jgi:hypothetical protein
LNREYAEKLEQSSKKNDAAGNQGAIGAFAATKTSMGYFPIDIRWEYRHSPIEIRQKEHRVCKNLTFSTAPSPPERAQK